MPEALFVFMRWLHISSMAALIGGIVYGRLVLTPAIEALAPEARDAVAAKAAAAFRRIVLAAVPGLLISGIFNLFANPGHSPRYHMLFGVKILLALHVFTMVFLITQPVNPRRARMMTGTLISGLVILAIAAYLRRIF